MFEFFIAGVKFHQMHLVVDELAVDQSLTLVPEPTNKYDPNAVRIEFDAGSTSYMLGYVPKKYSADVTAKLEIGQSLRCVITEMEKANKTWEMCKVKIYEYN